MVNASAVVRLLDGTETGSLAKLGLQQFQSLMFARRKDDKMWGEIVSLASLSGVHPVLQMHACRGVVNFGTCHDRTAPLSCPLFVLTLKKCPRLSCHDAVVCRPWFRCSLRQRDDESYDVSAATPLEVVEIAHQQPEPRSVALCFRC